MDKTILQRLQKNDPTLTTLNSKYNPIGVEGAQALAKALQSGNSFLTTLTLNYNKIGVKGAQALAKALQSGNSSLTTLKVEYNGIGDEGAQALAKTLQSGNSSLTTLILTNNQIGVEGARALATALQSKNSSLITLHLNSNQIGVDGARALATALQSKNSSLANLDLNDNQIGIEGARALAEALKSRNSSLITLNLVNNQIEERVRIRIKRYLSRNKRGQDAAKQAVTQILLIANFGESNTVLTNDLFDILMRNTAKNHRRHYLVETAKKLWSTRFEPVWWTKEERKEAEIEYITKSLKTVQMCISNAICSQEAKFVEPANLKNVFCSSYCQFIHYTGAPDLRGASPRDIKDILA